MALLKPRSLRGRARRSQPPWVHKALWAVCAAVLTAPPTTADAQSPPLEYAVKANFLYKFGPFVDWPAQAFAGPTGPFNVCIAGADPFGRALDEAVRGQTVAGHPVEVRRLQTVAAGSGCHVLFIGRSRQTASEIISLLKGAPVLTVTDEGVGTAGGVIHFALREGRVRFAIDVSSAQADGLAISSKLLGLAIPVQKGGG